MNIEIKKCDLCNKEYRSDIRRHWSDDISKIELIMSRHPAIQCRWDKDVCTSCALIIRDAIEAVIKELSSIKS